MPANTDGLYARKPFVLTLKGQVTVHFMDGQTLEGEIAAQDDLNVWLRTGDTPYLISRNQIRYIKGAPGQPIESEPEPETPAITVPPSSLLDTSPGAPQPALEPAVPTAHFVEEIEIPPMEDDTGGTIILPSGLTDFPLGVDQTTVHEPVEVESGDVGTTMVLPPGAELSPPPAETVFPGEAEISPTSLGETELLPTLEDDEDATFILSQKGMDEISAHLVCTTGPHAGEVLKLKPGITTIGRSSDNALALSKDKEVSRRHALIVYEANNFVLQDQNSLNGTFVNDQLIKEPRPLQDGDIILIGVSTLKFQESPKK